HLVDDFLDGMLGEVVQHSRIGNLLAHLRHRAGALSNREIAARHRRGFGKDRALGCHIVVDVPGENLAFVKALVGKRFCYFYDRISTRRDGISASSRTLVRVQTISWLVARDFLVLVPLASRVWSLRNSARSLTCLDRVSFRNSIIRSTSAFV